MLRGLLLDSGDTLMHPRGGRWDPRFDFEEVVRRHTGSLREDKLAEAIAVGGQHLDAPRANYHRAILAVLGVDDPSAALLEDLERPLPLTELVEPFADTADGLAWFDADDWRMAIVADTSPTMVEVYRALGLDGFIETFVISADLGCTKPDPRMYRTASDRLGLEPDECVFVDDRPDNLRGARALGYHAVGMARYEPPLADEFSWVHDLSELREHLRDLRGSQDARP